MSKTNVKVKMVGEDGNAFGDVGRVPQGSDLGRLQSPARHHHGLVRRGPLRR